MADEINEGGGLKVMRMNPEYELAGALKSALAAKSPFVGVPVTGSSNEDERDRGYDDDPAAF